jgi:hypothetical protein
VLLFREGCPYHKLLTQSQYDERPDILFVEAEIPSATPLVEGQRLSYEINKNGVQLASGQLRIKNAPNLPIISRRPSEPVELDVLGIIECSVNKSIEVATEQLDRYSNLFRPNHLALITGNGLQLPTCCNCRVDLNLTTETLLEAQFRSAAKSVLMAFGLGD